MGKILSAEQVAAFERDGYVFPVDAMSPDEARALGRRIEDYERETGVDATKQLRVKGHLVFPWLVELSRHPAILDAVEDLLGPDIFVYMSTFWFKGAGDASYVSWHQDSAYYGLDPHEEATVWFAFSDSTPESGCVRVIPGSHRGEEMVHVETYDSDNLLSRGQTLEGIDDSEAVDMVLRAGQFSIHHERLIHGSDPNRSAWRRMGISFIYIPAHVRSAIGRRSALLVRGEDRHGNWDPDPEPRFDLDPVCVEVMERSLAGYTDRAVAQEATRDG